MRRLLEWLDLSQSLSGALHVAVGLCGLAVVSGALLNSIHVSDAAVPAAGAALVASSAAANGHMMKAVASEEPSASIVVPAVFRQADANAALVRNAVAVTVPAIHINLKDFEKERRCLTEGVYFEARGESVVGQLAVAEVIINRATSGQYPASICGVVFQGQKTKQCQFSFACNGDMDKPRDPVAWRRAQRIAHYVLAGKVKNSIVGPATYYHATYVNPNWAQYMVEVAKIGQHIFYRTADESDVSNRS